MTMQSTTKITNLETPLFANVKLTNFTNCSVGNYYVYTLHNGNLNKTVILCCSANFLGHHNRTQLLML